MQFNINQTDYSLVTLSYKQTFYKYKKSVFMIILSGLIFFVCVIGFLLDTNFIIELKSQKEKEMVNMILTNVSIISQNRTSFNKCRTLINNSSLSKFKSNLDKYEVNKSYAKYITLSNLIISFLLLLSLITLVKINSESKIQNFSKKISALLAALFMLIELICLIIYVSIYMKTFSMHDFLEKTINNQCFTLDNFTEVNETIVYEVFITSFIPTLKFVYSCAIILMLIHFGNIIILLHKMKWLIIINLNITNSCNTPFNSTYNSRGTDRLNYFFNSSGDDIKFEGYSNTANYELGLKDDNEESGKWNYRNFK